jgi:tRNA modification GTPase
VGTAGIGVIRISGPQALEIASRIFRSETGSVQTFPSHTAHYGTLSDPVKYEPIDDVVITIFRAPKSYTGEDIIEISCHGSIVILKSALASVLAAGARLAEPGEFTRRAFLNGKIDLVQAEAVNDLIRASTDDARKVALRQLDGKLSENVSAQREKLLSLIASIEAAIDFPEDVDEPDSSWIESEIISAQNSINALLSSFGKGRIYREGLRVVIAGRVNVGKSSLLNALLRHARSIVTPIPGTTRDVIEESLEIDGIPIVAIDTAGFRATDDPIEKIGVELTEKSIESADIILLVFDISEGVNQTDVEMLQRVKDRPAIAVLNKIDLVSEEARGPKARKYVGRLGRRLPAVGTCASSGQGIGQLENEIAALVANKGIGGESVLVSNARHQHALQSAIESLDHALVTAQTNEPIDLLSVDLIAARDSLGLITGETATEDLLDRIFSDFCIGK